MIDNIDLFKVKQNILFMQGNIEKLSELKKINKDLFVKDFRNVDSAKYLLKDEMIYEITQNNINDFEAFIESIIKNVKP